MYHPPTPAAGSALLVAISGFRASDIGQYGIGNLDWYDDPTDSGAWWNIPVPVGALYDIWNPWRDPPARSVVSSVGLPAAARAQVPYVSPVAGTQALPTPYVIDPDFRPTETVFEDADEPWQDRTRPTDWDYVYEQYVILNAPEPEPVLHGSIDWGAAVGTILGGVVDPFGIGAAATSFFQPRPVAAAAVPMVAAPSARAGVPQMVTGAGCPPLGPKYAKICLATNEITPLRRRRRRRLLTSSDIKDLAALKAIVGGAALQGAVV